MRWMIPIPPSRAMAMAIWASVTVSMAALRRGIFRRMALGELGGDFYFPGQDGRLGGDQKDIIKRKTFGNLFGNHGGLLIDSAEE